MTFNPYTAGQDKLLGDRNMHTAYFDIDCGKMGKPTFRVDYRTEEGGVILGRVRLIKAFTSPRGVRLGFEEDISSVIPEEFEQYIIGLIRGEI